MHPNPQPGILNTSLEKSLQAQELKPRLLAQLGQQLTCLPILFTHHPSLELGLCPFI